MVKQLRHPSILKYVDMLEIEPHHFMLATEAVTPLRNMIHTMEHSEIFLGFVQIAVRSYTCHAYKFDRKRFNGFTHIILHTIMYIWTLFTSQKINRVNFCVYIDHDCSEMGFWRSSIC